MRGACRARKPPPATALCQPRRPWAASGVASLLSCPSVPRVHAHGQLPRAPTTAWIVRAAKNAKTDVEMLPTHSMCAPLVLLLVFISTASAFQNEGERN